MSTLALGVQAIEYLLWLDFETTGLDTSRCHLLEAAVVLTNEKLEEIDRGEWLTVPRKKWWAPQEVMDMHIKSGLLAAVNDAETDGDWYAISEIEEIICNILDDTSAVECTLAGSGVGTYDLPIIRRLMPTLAKRLTYHVHDVGVLRRAYRRATGTDLTPRHEPAHRAMADVEQSLTEARAFASMFRDMSAS